MTKREAMQRLIWRYGLLIALAGALSALAGAWLLASYYDVSPLHIRWGMTLAYLAVALTLGGGCWLAVTAWQDGAFRQYVHPGPYASVISPPFLVMLLWVNWPEAWEHHGLDNLLFGLGFIAAGLYAMRHARRKNEEPS